MSSLLVVVFTTTVFQGVALRQGNVLLASAGQHVSPVGLLIGHTLHTENGVIHTYRSVYLIAWIAPRLELQWTDFSIAEMERKGKVHVYTS